MIIWDVEKIEIESNILKKGFFLRDNMSKIWPLNTSLQHDNANVCFINSAQKDEGADKGTI